jgi:ferric-dicitrate binding protein FerR (iron transport regulator)
MKTDMLTKTTTETIDNMILSFLRGKITPEEKVNFESWLASSDENKAEFRKIYSIWKASSIQDQDNILIQRAFDKVQLHTFISENRRFLNSQSQKFPSRFLIASRKWAAIFIGIIIIGASVLFYIFSNEVKQDKIQANNIISVPLGSKSKIVLPDGTEVWLNAGSKLTYNMNFGEKTRDVHLVGEGYFKVTRQEKKPFIVHTVKASIKALGTEFNVKAYPDESYIETILVKGSIAVDRTSPGKDKNSNLKESSLILKPGQKARIYKVVEAFENKVEIPKTITPKRAVTEKILPKDKIMLESTDIFIGQTF